MADNADLVVRLEAAYREFEKTMNELELRADELIKGEVQKIDRAKIEDVLAKIKNISAENK